MHGACQRSHERVLDRPLPPLPRDRLDQELEHDAEVGPHHRADQQDRRQTVDVDLAAFGDDALGDEDDRQRVGRGPEEERDLPPCVAPDQVPVSLDHSVQADELVTHCCCSFSHANTPLSASSSFSSSNVRPVAAKNASSRVSTPYCSFTMSAGASAISFPRSRMPTRSASTSASRRSCVQSRIVASWVVQTSRMNSWTSSLERGSSPVVG